MYKVPLFALVALLMAGSASSQSLGVRGQKMSVTSAPQGARGTLHPTSLLANSPEGQAALATYRRLKENGQSPAKKSSGSEAAGSVRGFSVRNLETGVFEELEFTLQVQTDNFNIWVENAEMANGHVDNGTLEALRAALQDETPSASFDPQKGVLDLDQLVFGDPPDVDNSGRTDILVLDIRDGFDPSVGGNFAQGFVDPLNLTGGNVRDILHLDTFPSLAPGFDPNNLYLTAAHEYQHLIRFNYDTDELTFVDEGLSEWAEVMTGYGPRRNTYWTDPAELGGPLFNWRGLSSPSSVLDYQRAGLLTNYISQRIGVLGTGAITRSGAKGVSGYSAVLSGFGLSFADVLADFHVANTVNDAGVGAKYSEGPWFAEVSAAPLLTYDGAASTSASVATDGAAGSPPRLEPGGVAYHRWTNVDDFSIDVDALAGAGSVAVIRQRLRAFVVATPVGGSKTVTAVDLGSGPVVLTGEHTEVTLVVAHVDASLPGGFSSSWAPYAYSSNWTKPASSGNSTSIVYDDGNVVVISEAGGTQTLDAWPFSASVLGVDAMVANQFLMPSGSVLRRVDVATLFASDFDATIPVGAVDYTLRIHTPDVSSGGPGAVVLEMERVALARSAIPTLGFDQVDLTPHAGVLAGLSGVIFVSITNAGTDQNTLVVPLSEWGGAAGDNPSWFFVNFEDGWQWANFANITTADGPRFEDRVAPIRASFVTSTADEDEVVLPREFALETNYPNPFNPTTSIAFQLPVATQARIAVFDLLGREVAVLVDAVMPAGRHQVRFDASGLASGVYLYALDTSGQRLTRSMLLMK
jgi:Secretion system C-terminal sorting domain